MSVAEAYLEARVMSAPPYQLHLMVVEGALKFARQALQGMEQKAYDVSHFALNRSRDCINELIVGMNADQLPEIAGNLKSLFLFCYRNLTRADLQRNPALVGEAIQILEIHRQTWLELIQRAAVETPHAPAQEGDSDQPESRSWVS